MFNLISTQLVKIVCLKISNWLFLVQIRSVKKIIDMTLHKALSFVIDKDKSSRKF